MIQKHSIESEFEIFKNAEGNTISRLRKAGYNLESDNVEINTLDDFKKVLSRNDCTNKERLRHDLKLIYKNHMTKEQLIKFINMGEKEDDEMIRILPLNEDGGITVDDFIDYLFE